MAYEWPAGVQNCSGQLNAACLRPIRQILTPMPARGCKWHKIVATPFVYSVVWLSQKIQKIRHNAREFLGCTNGQRVMRMKAKNLE